MGHHSANCGGRFRGALKRVPFESDDKHLNRLPNNLEERETTEI
tara:strand:- start:284 stop:415 length:132 start_codon:yes stop_codon:yes gene_type:complete